MDFNRLSMNDVDNFLLDDDHLAHHGILGQKWGIRRFQNKDGTLTDLGKQHYSGRDYSRQLNELDKQMVNEVYKAEYASAKLKNLQDKAARDEAKGKMTPEKRKKVQDKAKKYASDYNDAIKRYEEGKSISWKVMGDAINNNYSIHSKYVTRRANEGNVLLAQMLAGPIGQIAMYSLDPTTSKGFIQGNKYSVVETPEGQKPEYVQYIKLKDVK